MIPVGSAFRRGLDHAERVQVGVEDRFLFHALLLVLFAQRHDLLQDLGVEAYYPLAVSLFTLGQFAFDDHWMRKRKGLFPVRARRGIEPAGGTMFPVPMPSAGHVRRMMSPEGNGRSSAVDISLCHGRLFEGTKEQTEKHAGCARIPFLKFIS